MSACVKVSRVDVTMTCDGSATTEDAADHLRGAEEHDASRRGEVDARLSHHERPSAVARVAQTLHGERVQHQPERPVVRESHQGKPTGGVLNYCLSECPR